MKQLSITFFLTVLISMVGTKAFAHDIAVANDDGVTIYYNFINDGTELEVTQNYNLYYNYYTGNIVIPEDVSWGGKNYKVTSIGSCAFGISGLSGGHTSNLRSVTIPISVTNIGDYAFRYSNELTSINIPESVISIGIEAFFGTPWYNTWYNSQPNGMVYMGKIAYKYKGDMPVDANITIASGTLGIADAAFKDCVSLTSITLPNGLINIGSNAFYGCSGLTSITVPNSVTRIGKNAFIGTSWYNSQPNGLVYAGKVAYRYKGSMPDYTCIVIKEGTLGISDYAFYGYSGLASVDIPKSVTAIGFRAFSSCSNLKSVTARMTQPLIISSYDFSTAISDNYNDATLCVPIGSKDAYEAVEGWRNFEKIVEFSDISSLGNTLYFDKADVRIGGQKTLSVKMKNAVEAEGFDFKLYLPDGFSFALDGNGMPETVLSTERTTASNTDMFSCAIQSDGALRVIGASTGGHVISGSDGEVARVKINIADSIKEDAYPVILKDIVISDVNASCYEVDSVKSTLDAFSYVLGDANRDTKVNVGDFTSAAHHILDRTPETFNVRAADANDDGKINVADLTAIAHLILYGTIERPSLSSRVMKKVATDISGLDNAIYIDPISLSAGAQHTLSVEMKNAVEAEGFGFDLTLPEGMTFATDGDNNPLVTLSTERTNSAKTNSFSYTILANGSLRVFGASTVGQSISGSDGEIVRIVINIDGSVAEGDYPLLLSNISISDVNALSYDIDQVEATVTVTPFVDDRIVLDENSTTSIENATNVNVRVLRTINANEWSTICLPFSMTEAQVYDAFGDNVELADFVSYTSEKDVGDNIVGISVGFSDVTAMEANHPYIIKVSNRIDEFSVEGVDIVVEDEPCTDFDNGKSGKNYVWYGSFTGTYYAQTTVPNLCLFLSGNKFWYSTGQTKMKAFRGYFDFEDKLAAVEQANARVALRVKDRTAGLKEVVNSKKETVCFDLQGRRIKSPTKKGLYVVNGKKMVIR